MLYAIIDPSYQSGNIEEVTRAILRGGASMVQLRDKSSTVRQIYALACKLNAICAEFETPFIVNDRLDIALASGADGVHLGPDDLPVEAARTMVDDDFIIGGSAGTAEAARLLQKAGADYLGVGAIYDARPSKANASAPRGPKTIGAVVDAVDIPVVGIGGIDETNAAAVIAHGATGVAVIRAILDHTQPEDAARRLCQVIADSSRIGSGIEDG